MGARPASSGGILLYFPSSSHVTAVDASWPFCLFSRAAAVGWMSLATPGMPWPGRVREFSLFCPHCMLLLVPPPLSWWVYETEVKTHTSASEDKQYRDWYELVVHLSHRQPVQSVAWLLVSAVLQHLHGRLARRWSFRDQVTEGALSLTLVIEMLTLTRLSILAIFQAWPEAIGYQLLNCWLILHLMHLYTLLIAWNTQVQAGSSEVGVAYGWKALQITSSKLLILSRQVSWVSCQRLR